MESAVTQIDYYRARSTEYDEWFYRKGRYDRGPEVNRRWFAEAQVVAEVLDTFRPAGSVLELACGTGIWTERLLRHADAVTAVDASSEMLALNARRLRSDRVSYVEADLFVWEPSQAYDVVFFSFWLSHVPPERFEDFWRLVRRALRQQGRFFLIDSLCEPTSAAFDHAPPCTHQGEEVWWIKEDPSLPLRPGAEWSSACEQRGGSARIEVDQGAVGSR